MEYFHDQRTKKIVDLDLKKEKILNLTANCLKQFSKDSADNNFQEVLMMIKELEHNIWSLSNGANLIDDDKHTYIEMVEMKSAHQLRM